MSRLMTTTAFPMTVVSNGEPPALPRHLDRVNLLAPEASEYLDIAWGVRVALATLAKLRSTGGGPPFCKFGRRVVYSRLDLDVWAQSRLGPKVGSTSELAAAGG